MNSQAETSDKAAIEAVPNKRRDRATLLSGIGFAKLSERRRRLLRYVLFISLGVHVLGMIIFGSIKLVEYLREDPPVIVAAPPAKRYEPRKVELKVKVQKRQRSSSRPAIVPRLVSMKPSELSLPEIKLDPKLVTTTFQPKFKAVSGKGLGAGLGTGYGSSGFGEGFSDVNFFDIQAKGERIAVLVDVSVSMVEDEKGGPLGYARVRERLAQVVGAMKDGTLFNVIVFADACSVMENQMIYSNEETRQKAKQFLRSYNTEGNFGLENGNFTASGIGLAAAAGTTRLDLALTAAMQQGADTILIISDGLPKVEKVQDADASQAHRMRVAEWNKQHAADITAYDQAVATATVRREWVPPTPARPPSKGGLKEGQKPDPGAPAKPGYWREVHDTGRQKRPEPPPMPPPGYWNLADFIRHMTLLYDSVYKPKSLKEPQVHCIGYQIDKDGGAFLRDLATHYKGQYRLVRKIR